MKNFIAFVLEKYKKPSSLSRTAFLYLRIRVHTRKEVVDTEVSHHDAQEGEGDVDVVGEWLAEDRQALRVNYHSIYHKGDERPSLLAIPTPVVAPTDIRPNGTDEDAEAHTGQGWIEEEAA